MGKLVFKVAVMLVIFLGISNYMFYIMTGKMPFSGSLPSFSAPSISAPDFSNLKPALPSDKDTAYKWTDEHGVVHYSSEPPPETVTAVKKMEVDPDTNMVQGLKIAPPETPATVKQPSAPAQPVVPAGAQQLLEDAKNVQNLLDERHERQKKAMGD